MLTQRTGVSRQPLENVLEVGGGFLLQLGRLLESLNHTNHVVSNLRMIGDELGDLDFQGVFRFKS